MARSDHRDDEWFAALPPAPTAVSSIQTPAPTADDADDADADTGRILTLPDPAPTAPAWQSALASLPAAPTAWSDDPQLTPETESTQSTDRPGWLRRHRSSLAVAASIGALATLIGAGAVLVLPSAPTGETEAGLAAELSSVGVDPTADPATSTSDPEPTGPLPFEQWCTGQPGGTVADTGSADPDLAAIARIEEAYYGSRDVAAARAVLASGVELDAAAFDAAVAAIPVGTEHCVLTAPQGAPSQYRVTVVERRPDGTEKRFVSSMTTAPAADGSSSVIAAIGPAS